MDDYVIVCAKFDFVSSTEQELNFKKGDRFILIDGRKDWWLVQTLDTEEFGYVPCNFMKAEKRNILSRMLPRRYQRKPFIANLTADVDVPADKVWAVKHSYEHKNVDELSLKKGTLVYIIEKKNDGWWYVECGNRKGWFPSNYLTPAPPNDSQRAGDCGIAYVAESAVKKPSVLCGIDVQWTCLSDNSLQMTDRKDLQGQFDAVPAFNPKRRSSTSFRLDPNSKSVDRDFGYSLRRFRPKGEGEMLKRCNSAVQLLPNGDSGRWDPYNLTPLETTNDEDFKCNSPKERCHYALCLCSFNSTISSELNVASGEVLRIIREASPNNRVSSIGVFAARLVRLDVLQDRCELNWKSGIELFSQEREKGPKLAIDYATFDFVKNERQEVKGFGDMKERSPTLKKRCNQKVKVENSYGQMGYVPLDVLAINDLYPSWTRSKIACPPESSNRSSLIYDGHRRIEVPPSRGKATSPSKLAKVKRRMDSFANNQAGLAMGDVGGQFASNLECFQITQSDKIDVLDRAWYFGCMSRDEADELLNTFGERGDFLLRDSYFTNGDTAYSVSVRSTNRNRHFRVYPTGHGEGRRYLIGRRHFRSLDQLVEFYGSHAIFKEAWVNDRVLNYDRHPELTFTHKEKLFLSRPLTTNPYLPNGQLMTNFELEDL